MGLLCVGTTRIKEIAEHLSLSPNTVNNHINSIFSKAKARSKSELLSFFLEFLVKRVERFSAYARAPKILYLHDGSEESGDNLKALRLKGIWAEGTTNVKSALGFLSQTPFDVFVYCNGVDQSDWRTIVRSTQKLGIYSPVLIAVGQLPIPLSEALGGGLADVVALNSVDSLYDSIRKHYINVPFCPTAEGFVSRTSVELEMNRVTLGRGGVFVDKQLVPSDVKDLGVDDHLELVMKINDRSLTARGQVVWQRDGANEKPGYGVRFTQLPPENIVELFKKIHDDRIQAYIPAGLS